VSLADCAIHRLEALAGLLAEVGELLGGLLAERFDLLRGLAKAFVEIGD
jgi:hypothetical protein